MVFPCLASASAFNFESFTVLTRFWLFQVNMIQYKPWHSTILWGTYQSCQEVWFGSEAFLVNCQLRPTWKRCAAGNTSAGMTRIRSKKRITSFMRAPCQPGVREMIFMTFCEREGWSNIFIILQNNSVWWGLNCKCVSLTSWTGGRNKEGMEIYIYTYTCTWIYILNLSPLDMPT